MHEWPIIHAERCEARHVQFSDEYAMIHLADGRIIGIPLLWFPPIHCAKEQQRSNYTCYGDTVYWHDLTAMLTGLYIVPIYQRSSRSEPHVPSTWQYLDGAARRFDGAEGVPFVEDTRNIPQALRFTKDFLIFELADGRVLHLPSRFSIELAQASDGEQQNYQLAGLTIRWEQLDESINLIAMLTRFYDPVGLPSEAACENSEAAAT
ncbi:MAG: hypothetical protein OXG85_02605 [Chloroflexi bacterium]|nr:hypothetical protein [Chloroflexota bacterium]